MHPQPPEDDTTPGHDKLKLCLLSYIQVIVSMTKTTQAQMSKEWQAQFGRLRAENMLLFPELNMRLGILASNVTDEWQGEMADLFNEYVVVQNNRRFAQELQGITHPEEII